MKAVGNRLNRWMFSAIVALPVLAAVFAPADFPLPIPLPLVATVAYAECATNAANNVEILLKNGITDNFQSVFFSNDVVKAIAKLNCAVVTNTMYTWTMPTNASGPELSTITFLANKLGTNWAACTVSGIAKFPANPPCSTPTNIPFSSTASNWYLVYPQPIILFTRPANGTNLTMQAGTTTNLETKVLWGTNVVTTGSVNFLREPTGLGEFAGQNPASLSTGTATLSFLASTNGGSGKIIAEATGLKSPFDPNLSLPDVSTNISANLPTLDLVFDNLPEDREEDPGAILCLDTNATIPRTPLDIVFDPGGRTSGELKLATTLGSSVKVWDAPVSGTEVTLPFTEAITSSDAVTKHWFVQAVAPADGKFTATYQVNPIICKDEARGINVELEFKARDGKINKGFDPTGDEPWTSVCTDKVSEAVKLAINPATASDKIELVVISGAEHADVTPKQFGANKAEVDLKITGKAAPGNTVIGVRIKGTNKICAKLNVMVLTERTARISIYRIEDPASPATGPVGGPTDAQVLATLNDVFEQACVKFQINDSPVNPKPRHYDKNPKDGKMQQAEIDLIHPEILAWKGPLNIFLIKKSGIPYPNDPAFFVRALSASPEGVTPFSIVFTSDSGANTVLIISHEIGHQLNLPVKKNAPDGMHDAGPFPQETDLLMKSGAPVNGVLPPAPGRWLRHEDWEKANMKAKDFQ